jgi:hypothetical protein
VIGLRIFPIFKVVNFSNNSPLLLILGETFYWAGRFRKLDFRKEVLKKGLRITPQAFTPTRFGRLTITESKQKDLKIA